MNAFRTYSLVPGWLHSEITAVGEEYGYQCDALMKMDTLFLSCCAMKFAMPMVMDFVTDIKKVNLLC